MAKELTARKPRRIGRWTYGAHPGLNPGWRLDDTNVVLDFNSTDRSGSLRGAYELWVNGQAVEMVDHYLDGAMDFVERYWDLEAGAWRVR